MDIVVKLLTPIFPMIDWLCWVVVTPPFMVLKMISAKDRNDPNSPYRISKKLVTLESPWDLLVNDFTIIVTISLICIVITIYLRKLLYRPVDTSEDDATGFHGHHWSDGEDDEKDTDYVDESPPVGTKTKKSNAKPTIRLLPTRNRRPPNRFEMHKIKE
jgi:hypothetical protein